MHDYSFGFMKSYTRVDAHGNVIDGGNTDDKRGLNPKMPFNAEFLEEAANKDNNTRGK